MDTKLLSKNSDSNGDPCDDITSTDFSKWLETSKKDDDANEK